MATKKLKPHPLSAIFPLMTGDEEAMFIEDCREHGIREPIWLFEDMILEGNNRYNAAEKLGIDCPTKEFKGDRMAALEFTRSKNLMRRQLTSSQLACIAIDMGLARKEIIDAMTPKEKAKMEKADEAMIEDATGKAPETSNGHLVEEGTKIDRLARAAELVGSNRDYISKATRVKEADPDLFNRTKAGDLSLADAARQIGPSTSSRGGKKRPKPFNDDHVQTAIEKLVELIEQRSDEYTKSNEYKAMKKAMRGVAETWEAWREKTAAVEAA